MEDITRYLITPTVHERGIVRAWEETVALPTYEVGKAEKNPVFLEKRVYQGSSGAVYPYPVIETVSDEKKDKPYKAVFIENEYLKIMLLPELGGRVQMAYDKVKQRHFVYYNQVIKPALVGLAGPWISGGIEFNWPQHHRPSTFLPTDYCIEEHPDGSATVWCNEVERMSRMKDLHGFTLRPGKAYLEINVKIYNRTPFPQTFLWWANPAVSVNEHYHSVFPPDVHAVFDHGKRDVSTFPIATGTYYKQDYSAGVDISRYKNIPVPTSYMAASSKYDFVGGYEEDTQCGLLHVANRHISPGKKQWTWGCGDFGQAWDRNLTDEDGPYIELMTGVFTDNQPDFSWLQPGEERAWTQYFMPYSQVGYVKNANKDAIINVESTADGAVTVKLYTTSEYKGLKIVLKDALSGAVLSETVADVAPEKPLSLNLTGLGDLLGLEKVTVEVYTAEGEKLIDCQPEKEELQPLPEPAKAALDPKEIKSVEQLYLTGLHLEQYRHATYNPTDYYLEGLRRDEGDVRCNNAMGLYLLRRAQFAEAEQYFRRAIATLTQYNPNPYDGEPYYNLGICIKESPPAPLRGVQEAPHPPLRGVQDRRSVESGSPPWGETEGAFFKAAWNAAWQAPAYFNLAQIDCMRHNYLSALEHIERSLIKNLHAHRARALKASILRKLGRKDEALQWIAQSLAIDPFNIGCRFEKFFLTNLQSDLDAVFANLRHTPHDLLEYALDFAGAGMYEEAIDCFVPRNDGKGLDVIANAVKQSQKGNSTDCFVPRNDGVSEYPIIYYALGWFSEKAGDGDKALDYYRQAALMKPDYCFPNRIEEVIILEAAIAANPADAKAPYYLGNFMYAARRYDEAIKYWEQSASQDRTFPTVLRNLALAYYNKRGDKLKAQRLLEEAFALDMTDARILMELDQLYKKTGKPHAERLALLEQHSDLTRQRDDLCIEHITLCNQLGDYEKAMSLLAARKFHPWEGGEGKVTGQYVLCRRELAKKALQENDFATALRLLHETDAYPHNLGEGKLINTEENDIDYYKGLSYRASGDEDTARRYLLKATQGSSEPQQAFFYNDQQPDRIYYQGLAWRALGNETKARSCFNRLIAHGKKHLFDVCRIDYFAVSLPDLAIWEDDLDERNREHCRYLIELGEKGLKSDN